MKFRSARQIKQDFLSVRSVQAEEHFLRGCNLNTEQAETALRIRAAIANLGGVESAYIHAEDTFDDDLSHFDFWGSLDTVDVVLELEKQLRVSITDEQMERIVNPDLVRGLTVASFVCNVLEVISHDA